MKKEISSGKIQKQAICESAMCPVNSPHSFKLVFSLSSFLTLFIFSVRRDIRERFEAYVEKGNMFRYKLDRSFLMNCFVMCAFHSQCYTSLLIQHWGNPFEEKGIKGYSGAY